MGNLRQPTVTDRQLRTNQAGIASFLVTMVLMVVITLIVMGFGQISRRNQREALDEQLSSQAYYAAETGVNLVQNLLKDTTAPASLEKTDCSSTAAGVPAVYSTAQFNDTATNIANTCLLVNPAPTSLVYDNIGINSTVVPLQPDGDYGNSTLHIEWQTKAVGTPDLANCPTNGGNTNRFTRSDLWAKNSDPTKKCLYGVLRIDLVDATSLTADDLQKKSMTIFAPPTDTGHPIVKYESDADEDHIGDVDDINCDATSCTMSIDNLNFSGHTYYMRLLSLYNNSAIKSISAKSDTLGDVKFINAQLVVDSTGQAVDVLRRVSVRLDQYNQMAPSFAIQGTDGVCKLISATGPGKTGNLTDCNAP